MVVTGAAVGVRVGLRHATRIRDTAAKTGLLLPPALAAAVAVAVAVGRLLDRPLPGFTTETVLLITLGNVLAFVLRVDLLTAMSIPA